MSIASGSKRARTAHHDTSTGIRNKCNGDRKKFCVRSGGNCSPVINCNVLLSASIPSSRITAPSNLPKLDSHSQKEHPSQQHVLPRPGRECAAAICRTFLWLYICALVTGGTMAAEPYVSACKYPDPVEYALVKPLSTSRGGFYPNGSKAHVDCYSNFRVRHGDPSLICVNGEWTGINGRTVECGK